MKKVLKITNFIVGLSLVLFIAAGCGNSPTATAAAETQQNLATATEEPTEAVTETATSVAIATTAGNSIDGRWEGSLTVAGSSLPTIVNFITEDGVLKATLDIPAQGLAGYQLSNVSFVGSSIHFEGFEESGRKAVWDGSMQEDGKITGDFTQIGYTGTFELSPAEQVAEITEVPLPYKEEEVSVTNGEITLGGTLTLPESEGPFPAVVLITGSGPQNRDEEIFGFKIFAVIADQLTRNGIAVIRYDDRGMGSSTGNLADSTTSDLAQDVLAWVEYLKTRSEIDPAKIGLMGHSEGGIIAPIVAAETGDVAYIVLMAGPAIIGEEIIYKQVELIARASGSAEEEITAGLNMQRQIFDGLIRGKDWEGAKAAIRQQIADQVNALPDEQKQALGDLNKYIDTVYQAQIETLESKWYRYFIEYDPAPVLEKTTVPVLAFFGGLDMQVPADPNAEVMKTALEKAGNTDVTILTYPNANHLFQEAVTGSPNEYASLKQEFVPEFLNDLTTWILKKTSNTK